MFFDSSYEGKLKASTRFITGRKYDDILFDSGPSFQSDSAAWKDTQAKHSDDRLTRSGIT